MRAAVFDRVGPPETVLGVRDVPTPAPGPGEVLVRMIASPVNPSDLLFVSGSYGIKPRLPATPGFEGVGVVAANGGGLLGWLRNGRRVAVLNDGGNWAEYAVTPARHVYPVPDEIPDEIAASFFVNPATAYAITRRVLRVPAGEWLLQTAAGSELGKMVIRLGRRYEFRTVNVVRRREQVEELKQLGADVVLVDADGPLPGQVRSAVGSDGVRYAMDPVGGETGSQVVAALAPGGRVVVFGVLSGQPMSIDPRFLISGSKRVEGFWLSDFLKRQSIPQALRIARRVRGLTRDGVLTTHVAATYPLEQVCDAVRHAAAPGKGGKVLLRISPR